jgi:hypothetical protein
MAGHGSGPHCGLCGRLRSDRLRRLRLIYEREHDANRLLGPHQTVAANGRCRTTVNAASCSAVGVLSFGQRRRLAGPPSFVLRDNYAHPSRFSIVLQPSSATRLGSCHATSGNA